VDDIEQEWHEYMNGTYPNPDVPDRDELKKVMMMTTRLRDEHEKNSTGI